MPTFNKERQMWAAKRKRGGRSCHIGYYEQPVMAQIMEILFDIHYPRAYKNNNPLGISGDMTLRSWRHSVRKPVASFK